VITEIARCLRPGGTAIFAVKSRDSYRELDELIAAAGIDPDAISRPSLYETAHSGNIAELAATSLVTRRIIDETHEFCFPTLADAAGYLATSPKYGLPAGEDPATLTRALQRELPDQTVTTTSVVTYLVATRPRGSR
jgi:SAM-dependent methyltransferase